MIFEEQISRKPDRYPWAQEFIKSAHEGFWTDKEFNFASDVQDFKTSMTDEEREIIKKTMSAIGQIEVAVKRFWARLGDNLPHSSLSDLGYTLANTEVIHGNAYERLLNVLGISDVFEENLKLDIFKNRVHYLKKYNEKCYKDSKKQYIYALILFSLFIENVSLFSQFYIALHFNRNKNYLKDTAQQIAYTSKEEQLHALVGIKIINTIKQEHPELFDDELEERILHEAQEAFKAEEKILEWILGDFKEEALDINIAKEFIKNRINDSLVMIGFGPAFEIDRDMLAKTVWFDEQVLGNSHTDFFHSRPIEYSKNCYSFAEEDLF